MNVDEKVLKYDGLNVGMLQLDKKAWIGERDRITIHKTENLE